MTKYYSFPIFLFLRNHPKFRGNSLTFHYYIQDYFGNNRALINGSEGVIKQTANISIPYIWQVRKKAVCLLTDLFFIYEG